MPCTSQLCTCKLTPGQFAIDTAHNLANDGKCYCGHFCYEHASDTQGKHIQYVVKFAFTNVLSLSAVEYFSS